MSAARLQSCAEANRTPKSDPTSRRNVCGNSVHSIRWRSSRMEGPARSVQESAQYTPSRRHFLPGEDNPPQLANRREPPSPIVPKVAQHRPPDVPIQYQPSAIPPLFSDQGVLNQSDDVKLHGHDQIWAPTSASLLLFMAQCNHWIDFGCTSRRKPTRKNCHTAQNCRHHRERHRVIGPNSVELVSQ